LKHKSVSLWSFINASPELYRNPLYGGTYSSVQTVLKPVASMRHIRLWKGLYCRWNPSMRQQDPIYQRTRELLALQEQLRRQVEECRFETTNTRLGNQTRLASPLH
jgi:myotubularin-related protein 1/2